MTTAKLLSPSVVPPVLTPYLSGDLPDWESLGRQAAWLADQGVDGLWLNGSTGEFHTLTEDERTQTVRTVVEAVAGHDLPIIDNVGATSTRLATRLAERSIEAGATGLAVVLPYYLHYDEEECMEYLRSVKRASGGAPIYLYQVPDLVRMLASDRVILTLLEEGTIQGMKESWGNLSAFRVLMETAAERGLELPAFTGDSALLTSFMIAGGSGTITALALVLPRHIGRNLRAIRDGDWDLAIRLQSETTRFVQAMRPAGRPNASRMATIKALMAIRGIIQTPLLAEPFRQLSQADLDDLRDNALPILERLEDAATAA